MGKIKSYLKQELQLHKLYLQHDSVGDFHQCIFQNNRSALPSLIIRGVLFFGCLGILITSIVMTGDFMSIKYWPIYLTHWGLVLITLACGFGFAVSAKVYFRGPIDSTFGLPWYVKAYWAAYSTTIPVALFITVFYWTFLTNDNQEYATNLVLDIFIHAINSVVMLVLLLTARQPSNLMHFYFSIILPIVYLIFSVIYYWAGGTDFLGNVYVYPVLDWSKAGEAMITVVLCAVLLLILHIIVTLISEARDAVDRSCENNTNNFNLS